MKIYSWNVNGIRAVLRKGVILEWVGDTNADIICLQETKAHAEQLPPELLNADGYDIRYCSGERKGYSGVTTWSRPRPNDVRFGFGMEDRFDVEGRILHHVYDGWHLLNIYFPNGQKDNERLQYKLDFYEACQTYCQAIVDSGESVIVCGDVNTAHNDIDLARPDSNRKTSGFMPIERAWIDRFTEAGYIDVFRRLHPDKVQYSWWSMQTRARERNVGWRIDYFFISPDLLDKVVDCRIHDQVVGSDHCPISLEIDL